MTNIYSAHKGFKILETTRRTKGDVVTVPAGTPHKFTNAGSERAITFSVYSPPAYR
jgi:mannose-6-phosphate isomerase-like protein (cupin superfamily)